jgi:hypothetical protein
MTKRAAYTRDSLSTGVALLVLVVFAAPKPTAAQSGDPEPTGKIVYEEGLQPDKERNPAIVVRDMETLHRQVLAAPGMNPR